MSNLFSAFNPLTGPLGLSLNWVSLGGIFLLPSVFWTSQGKLFSSLILVQKILSKEVSLQNFKGVPQSINIFLLTLFMMIFMNNFLGLLPYVFTATSHPSVTLFLGLSLWTGYFLYYFTHAISSALAHLVPSGTPLALIPFMVLIELLSSCMRPFTLAIRLAANLMAGHLLLILISGPMASGSFLVSSVVFPVLLLLIFLELGVSLIQSYVFISLSSLYIEEVNISSL